MTFAPPEVSRTATRRIGVANAVLWIAGSIVLIVVGATAAYGFVVAPYTGGGYLGGGDYPWDADQPLVATEADGVWSADASGVIRIPAAGFTEPYEASVIGDAELGLYRTNPDEEGAYTDDYFFPTPLGYLYNDETLVIVPSDDDLELWVGAGEAWQLRLAPLNPTLMDDEGAEGSGDAYLVYSGDAVSARFIYAGDGIFFVSIYTAFTNDRPIIESGDVNERLSWEPDTYVVFEIESDDGTWFVDIDELAQSTPTPAPTPTETP